MVSERLQRRIDRLLDQIEVSADDQDWRRVVELAEEVLGLDPGNADASAFLSAAERRSSSSEPVASLPGAPFDRTLGATSEGFELPTSFANGRYEVRDFLGEGGKKRVYRAHDSILDRDVALAVIKTEGLDATSRVRITREAQALGRLGDHPHVLSIHDLGDEGGQPYMVLPRGVAPTEAAIPIA